MGEVHLLVNPQARGGRGDRVRAAVRTAARARGADVVELASAGEQEVAGAIDTARASGMTRLVIAGGDGLIHHALPALACSDITVGIVPVGTGNDFARALGLPTRIKPAVEAALSEPTPIDLISISSTTFSTRWAASVVTGGFSGKVNARANGLRFPPGQQRYTVATFLELSRLCPVELELDVDGSVHRESSSLFAVANSRYFGGGMAICPEARPDDGQLDVTVVGPVSRRVLAWMLPTVFSGRHVSHPCVTTYRGRVVKVTTDADLWADGEPITGTSFSAAPGALHVAGSVVRT
jgi:diacylglycerol kinase (ATP)